MKKILLLMFIIAGSLCTTCKKNNSLTTPNPVPYVTVNETLNMDNPLYSALNNMGGYVYMPGVGYKGIVVVHDYSDQFYALDRTCPYHINSNCGAVTMEKSGLVLGCGSYNSNNSFQECCKSTYSLDGNIMSGPTTYPLKRYKVLQQGSDLIISN